MSKIKKQPTFVNVQVCTDDIVDALQELGPEDLADVVLRIDLAIADAGFTEELVRTLLKSLAGDLSGLEWLDLIDELRGLKT